MARKRLHCVRRGCRWSPRFVHFLLGASWQEVKGPPNSRQAQNCISRTMSKRKNQQLIESDSDDDSGSDSGSDLDSVSDLLSPLNNAKDH